MTTKWRSTKNQPMVTFKSLVEAKTQERNQSQFQKTNKVREYQNRSQHKDFISSTCLRTCNQALWLLISSHRFKQARLSQEEDRLTLKIRSWQVQRTCHLTLEISKNLKVDLELSKHHQKIKKVLI